jgi:hypothetical protein
MADSPGIRAGLKGNVEEALRLFAREAEWAGLNLAETEFVLEETLKCYGATFDGAMILELFKFYRRYLGMANVGRRQQLLTRMTEYISSGHSAHAIALLCFISADTDGQITSGAALDLAMVMTPDKGDPLTGPKFVAFHGCGGVRVKLGKPAADHEGDVAAGLLLLGDMRLLPLLEEIWERLTPGARHRMIRRRSNLVTAAMVEFLLRRLEADQAEEYFGELGAALHNLPEIASRLPMAVVMDVQRNFGLPAGKEPMELLGREDMATAFARIRPRLEALLARESEPKVLPSALAAWAEAAGVDIVEEDADDSSDEAVKDNDDSSIVLSPELRDEFEEISARFNNELSLICPKQISVPLNPYEVWPKTYAETAKVFSQAETFPVLLLGRYDEDGPEWVVYLITKENDDSWNLYRYVIRPEGCYAGWIGMMEIDDAEMFVNGRRAAGAVPAAYDFATRLVMGHSLLTPAYTYFRSSSSIGDWESTKGASFVAGSMPDGLAELQDLLRAQREQDPEGRLARKIKRSAAVKPQSMTPEESSQLADLLHSPEVQRDEMKNIIQLWEQVAGSDSGAVVTADQMLKLLAHLSVDMPGLLKLDGEFVYDQRPIVDRRDDPEHDELIMPGDFPTRPPGRPDYVGLMDFLHSFSLLEIPLSWAALIWALCLAEWWLAAVLAVFAWVMFKKRDMMGQRQPAARWLGVGAYLGLWGFVRAYFGGQEFSAVQSGGLFNLRMLLSWWGLILGGLTLVCFNYAESMRSAPNEKE